jgi:hypothetical protein
MTSTSQTTPNLAEKNPTQEYLQKIEAEIMETDRICELLKSYGTCYLQDMTIDNSSRIVLGFHKAYWSEKNNMMLDEAADNSVAAKLPFFGSERACFKTEETPIRPQELCYHKIAGHTLAVSWSIGGDGYLLFVGIAPGIATDLAMLVAGTTCGGDMWTDLESLAFQETPLRYGSKEREEMIWSLIGRQNDFSGERDPEAFSRKAAPETMIAVGLSPRSIALIRKLPLDNIVPICQVPFGIGGYHDVLIRDYGFDESSSPKLYWEKHTHPMFPVYPGLYICPCGALLDENGSAVIGTVEQLISFFSVSGVIGALDVYERTLVGKLGIA